MAYATKQYQAVLRCLEQRSGQALTAADLSEDLRHAGNPVGLATIYRQLEKLEAEHHFLVDARRTVLTGRCRDCTAKEVQHGIQ